MIETTTINITARPTRTQQISGSVCPTKNEREMTDIAEHSLHLLDRPRGRDLGIAGLYPGILVLLELLLPLLPAVDVDGVVLRHGRRRS